MRPLLPRSMLGPRLSPYLVDAIGELLGTNFLYFVEATNVNNVTDAGFHMHPNNGAKDEPTSWRLTRDWLHPDLGMSGPEVVNPPSSKRVLSPVK